MFFKALSAYRLVGFTLTTEQMQEAMLRHAFVPAASNERQRTGWASPRNTDQLVHKVGNGLLLCLRTESKVMPAAAVAKVLAERRAELEEQQGFPPGRKATKELKERVEDELLPKALSTIANLYVWIDLNGEMIYVDTPSAGNSDHAIKVLLKTFDRLPIESLRVVRSPVACMTDWLELDEAPAGFTVDRDCELRATGESKAAVRFVNHTLEPAEVQRHIKAGKKCTRLGLTWNDRVSFTMTEGLAIKGIRPLDILRENATAIRDDAERFDADFMLMQDAYGSLMRDLIDALGGIAKV